MGKKHSTGCLGIAGIFSDFFIVVVFVDIVFVVVVIVIVVAVVIVFDAIAVVVCNADIQHLQSNPSSSAAASQCQSGPGCLFADAASRTILQFFLFVCFCFFAFCFCIFLLNQMLPSIPVLQLFSFHFSFHWSWIRN